MRNPTPGISVSFVALLFLNGMLYGQSLMYEIPLNKQVEESSLIVEGKVIAKHSYWDANHQNIYTVQTVEVYKVFKGKKMDVIDVVTPGGIVGEDAEIVYPSLELNLGDLGVFILESNSISFDKTPTKNIKSFKVYSSLQGYYEYNLSNNNVANTFSKRTGITTTFYSELERLTKNKFSEVQKINIEKEVLSLKLSAKNAVATTTLNPTMTSAGTRSIISISGANFGISQGTGIVEFPNANSSAGNFIQPLASQIVKWSDTLIQVEVPTDAGSGYVKVTPDGSGGMLSEEYLDLNYAELNVNYDWGNGQGLEAYSTRHVNRDGNGGYTWQMHTDFDANTEAKEAFVSAMDSWRCETGVNWTMGSVSTNDEARYDNVNIVRFDNESELPAGVLGKCTTRLTLQCVEEDVIAYFYVKEMDLVFNDTTTWNFGPNQSTSLEFDFESVVLHELGHAHQLGHVINSEDVMHYAVVGGQDKRDLTLNVITGAGNVQARSLIDISFSCGTFTEMISYACPQLERSITGLGIEDEILAQAITIFPNPTVNELFIKNQLDIELKEAIIYDVSGRLLSRTNINDFNPLKRIDVNKLSKGVYFINIISDKGSLTRKFVLK